MPVLRAIRLLFLASLIASAAPARAAGDDAARQRLDAAHATLAEIDAALKADNLADADLARLGGTRGLRLYPSRRCPCAQFLS